MTEVIDEYMAKESPIELERHLKDTKVITLSRDGHVWKEYICLICGFKTLTFSDAIWHVQYHSELKAVKDAEVSRV